MIDISIRVTYSAHFKKTDSSWQNKHISHQKRIPQTTGVFIPTSMHLLKEVSSDNNMIEYHISNE